MSEQLKEALSAVVDAEADVFELRRVLDEVGRSPELGAAWRRYHLIGEHLRGEHSVLPQAQLDTMADQVWAGVMDEIQVADQAQQEAQPQIAALQSLPETNASNAPAASASMRRWAPFAVAASVALMVTLGVYTFDSQEPVPAVAENTIEIEGPVYQLQTEVSPNDIQRANAYMLHHVQQKALNQPGVASFVKVVTFEKSK